MMNRTSRPYDLSLEEDRRAVIASALGSHRASGTEPDASSLADLDTFVRGELDLDQARARAQLMNATIAGLIRKLAAPGEILAQQRELFGRMAFNVMIDNTDDHTKNHAFLRREDGTWALSPAYDIPVQMNGLGVQAIQISPDPMMLNRFDREHAVAAAPRFGMRPEEALAEWNRIAGHVALWRDVFADVGVTEGDIDYVADFLDSPEKREHRKDATPPQNGGLDGGPN